MSWVPAQEEFNLGRKCPTCSDLQRIEPVSAADFLSGAPKS